MPSEREAPLHNRHYSCGASWPGRRHHTCMSVCGIMLIAVGLFWLSVRMGWLPASWPLPAVFWPAVIIYIGIWIVAKPMIRRRSRHQ